MLLTFRVLESLNNTEETQPIIMYVIFHSNPCTTIISCCSLTNDGDETDITTFYDGISSLIRHIPKYTILIIGGDMNVQISKDENNKFGLLKLPYRNGKYRTNFLHENNLSYLNTKFQKREGKLWTYIYQNTAKHRLYIVNPFLRWGFLIWELFFLFIADFLSSSW